MLTFCQVAKPTHNHATCGYSYMTIWDHTSFVLTGYSIIINDSLLSEISRMEVNGNHINGAVSAVH